MHALAKIFTKKTPSQPTAEELALDLQNYCNTALPGKLATHLEMGETIDAFLESLINKRNDLTSDPLPRKLKDLVPALQQAREGKGTYEDANAIAWGIDGLKTFYYGHEPSAGSIHFASDRSYPHAMLREALGFATDQLQPVLVNHATPIR